MDIEKRKKFRKTVYLDVDVVKVVKVESVEQQKNESELINEILRKEFGLDENFF